MQDFSSLLSSPDGTPSKPLRALVKALELPINGSFTELSAFAQTHFLRGPNQERWHIKASPYDLHREELIPLFRDLGLVDTVGPSKDQYDSCYIHGGVVYNLRARLKYLDDLWYQAVRAASLILITCDRPFDPQVENENTFFDQEKWEKPDLLPSSQIELAQLLWDQMITHPDLRKMSPLYLVAESKKDQHTGRLIRANTAATIYRWLETKPDMGDILAISNNPYISYQHSILRNVLTGIGADVTFETVGPAAENDVLIGVYLDTLARWMYAELEYRHL